MKKNSMRFTRLITAVFLSIFTCNLTYSQSSCELYTVDLQTVYSDTTRVLALKSDTIINKDSIDLSLKEIISLEADKDLEPVNLTIDKSDKKAKIKFVEGKRFIPNPTRAAWMAVAFPGGGQIYNRKYWKLPLLYGGFAGCAYAFAWNSKTYKDYSQAFIDITDNNPNTKSYEDLLPRNANYSIDQLRETIKSRKDLFRKYRDLSILAFIGVYIISIVDAYVDAELSNFDISQDLSMKIEPVIMNNRVNMAKNGVGMQCTFSF